MLIHFCICDAVGVYAMQLVYMPCSWCICHAVGVYVMQLVYMSCSWCICDAVGVLYSVFGTVNQFHSIHHKLVDSQLIAACNHRTTELVAPIFSNPCRP